MQQITVAIPRGRNLKPSVELFKGAGVDFSECLGDSRKLVFEDGGSGVRAIIVRDTDIPAYVEDGAADLGVAGKDQLGPRLRQMPARRRGAAVPEGKGRPHEMDEYKGGDEVHKPDDEILPFARHSRGGDKTLRLHRAGAACRPFGKDSRPATR